MGLSGIDLRLLYRLAPAFVAGAGLGIYGHGEVALLLALCLLCLGLALGNAERWVGAAAEVARDCLALVLLLSLSLGAGAYCGADARPHAGPGAMAQLRAGSRIRAHAEVLPGARHRPNGVRVPVLLSKISPGEAEESLPGTARALLYVLEERNAWIYSPGAQLEVSGRFQRPDNYANPGTHSYGEYLESQGIEGILYVRSPRQARVARWPYGLTVELAKRRDRFVHWVEQQAGASGGLVAALAAGDRSLVSAELTRSLRDAGLSHILAISGLHVAIAGGFFFFLVRWLLLRSERLARVLPVRKVAVLAALLGVAAYAVLSGLSEATQRAGWMFGAAALALVLERRLTGLRALTLAALIITLAEPRALASISFQLSFAAAGTIILAFSWLSARRGKARETGVANEIEGGRLTVARRYLLRAAGAVLLSSLAANLATWPLVAFYFNRVSLSGIASNLLVLPVVELALLPFSLLTMMLWNLHPPLAEGALQLAVWSSELAAWLAELSARWLPLRFDLRAPPPALLPLYFAGLLAFGLWLRERSRVLAAAAVACAGVFLLGYAVPTPAPRAQLEVQVIDAGSARVRLARWPDGRSALIDLTSTRSRFPYYERAVLPALLAAGAGEVDLLVVGPGGAARAEALAFYRERLNPAAVWDLGDAPPSEMPARAWPEGAARVQLSAKGGRARRGWAVVVGGKGDARYVLDGEPGYWPTAWTQLWEPRRTVLDFAPRALGLGSNRWLVGRVDPAVIVGTTSEGRESVTGGWARLRFEEGSVEVVRR